jgi:hypothetical protein
VKITLQSAQVGISHGAGLTEVIDKIHQGQQSRGFLGRSAGEIEAGLHEGESEYERKMQAIRSQTN